MPSSSVSAYEILLFTVVPKMFVLASPFLYAFFICATVVSASFAFVGVMTG